MNSPRIDSARRPDSPARSRPMLVFLHGVGSARSKKWLSMLNQTLESIGREPIAGRRVAVIDYRFVLMAGPSDASTAVALLPTADASRTEDRARYEARAELIRDLARGRTTSRRVVEPGDLHPRIRRPLARGVRKAPRFREAELYRSDERRRHAVLHAVSDQLPPTPFVLVAHSLGSQVAADLLCFLPVPFTPRIDGHAR